MAEPVGLVSQALATLTSLEKQAQEKERSRLMVVRSGMNSLEFEIDGPLTDVLREILASAYREIQQWDIKRSNDERKAWLLFQRASIAPPSQGWKLHISADLSSAETILRRALPILLTKVANFKVLASLEHLAFLNQGGGGLSQIGKFITIYSENTEEAVRLAGELDRATRGLSGPNVPSDRPLQSGSRVYYRYGGFRGETYIQEGDGRVLPAILTPENQLVPDQRLSRYQAPTWVVDPFLAAGVAVNLPRPARLIGGRYFIVKAIAESIDHTLYMAADLAQVRSCIIKSSGCIWNNNPFIRELRERLRCEAEALAQLGSHSRIPGLIDLIEQDGEPYLVMQDIEGETLETHLTKLKKTHLASLEQVVAWSGQLAQILEFIHQQGYVYSDVKSSNVMINAQEQIYLIDFGHARMQGGREIKRSGTRGYMSPQQQKALPVTIQDDIYSFGTFLYFLITGAEPSFAPHSLALLERPLEVMRPDIGMGLKDLVTRCLEPEPEARYASMAEVRSALASLEKGDRLICRTGTLLSVSGKPARVRANAHQQVEGLLQTLCSSAKQPTGSEGLAWSSSHPRAGGIIRRDIYLGNAGVVLALAELAATLADKQAQSILTQAAHWLSTSFTSTLVTSLTHQALPGLYIGEAGVGAALLRAGQVLQDKSLSSAAIKQGRQVAAMPYMAPDMMNGSAGRLRFHLLLWDETKEHEHLEAALACGEHLLNTYTEREHGEVCWGIPEGYGNLSGARYLGYAYGAAGIADALLDLLDATGDERYLAPIRGVGRWLARRAVPALEDGSGLTWPLMEGKPELAGISWCHGATGIGRFFLHAARQAVLPGAWEIARRAARTVFHAARWSNPTQALGLAGHIEFLLDMYQASGEQTYYEEAFVFEQLLAAFASEQNGHLFFSSDYPDIYTPSYMLGYSGIALCFLRLSMPEELPHQISRAGFRFYRQLGEGKHGIRSVK